jgi:Flp pilus assembly pilin Flp
MKQFLLKLWQDETGTETAEWLVIAALIVGIGLTVYNGTLEPGLNTVATNISNAVGGIAVPAGP